MKMENRMKKRFVLTACLIAGIALPLFGDWVEDTEFKFKINVPASWQKSRLDDGSDRVHTFLSPDQNLAVRVRAFTVNENVSLDLVVSLFKNNILGECEQLALMDETINGYEGKVGAYRGIFNGTTVGAGVFYTIQNGIAYIVWSMAPIDLFQSKVQESDAITGTFAITGGKAGLNLANFFQDGGLGYSIHYPEDWVYEKSKPYIVVFSGPEGSPAYYSTVTIQNLASTLMGGNFNSVDEVIEHFRIQMERGAALVSMTVPESFTVQADGKSMSGKVYTITYTRENTRFRQRMVILPRFDMKLFYAYMFTASAEDYDTYYPVARAMLETWTIQ